MSCARLLPRGTRRPLWSFYNVVQVESAQLTHAYVVSNAAACALVKALYPVRHVADAWNWLRRHRIARIQALDPPCITLDMSHHSNIGSPSLPKSGLLGRVKHKSYRAWWLAVDHTHAAMRRIAKYMR